MFSSGNPTGTQRARLYIERLVSKCVSVRDGWNGKLREREI